MLVYDYPFDVLTDVDIVTDFYVVTVNSNDY